MEGEEIIKGIALPYNVGTQEKYLTRVTKKLVNPLMNETEYEVNNLFDEFAAGLITFKMLNARSRKILNQIEKKYGVIFKVQAEKIAKAYIKDIQNYSKSGVKRNVKVLSLGRTTAFKENKGNIDEIDNISHMALVALIIGMKEFYLAKARKQVEQTVLTKIGRKPSSTKPIKPFRINETGEKITPGKPVEIKETKPAPKSVLAEEDKGVREYLDSQRGITHRKSKNDLSRFYRGTYNAFNREYLFNNDLNQWQWVHTDRAKEQNPYHVNSLSGLVFNYDSPPPVIDQRTGTTGYPGDWYGCMCIMLPVKVFLPSRQMMVRA